MVDVGCLQRRRLEDVVDFVLLSATAEEEDTLSDGKLEESSVVAYLFLPTKARKGGCWGLLHSRSKVKLQVWTELDTCDTRSSAQRSANFGNQILPGVMSFFRLA